MKSLLATACLLVLAHAAHAQRLIVSDMAGDGDEPLATSLLLRSMLRSGERPLVGRAELKAALDKAPQARATGLVVNPAGVQALCKELSADRLLAGELSRDDVHLELTLRVYDRSGALVSASSVRTARGELAPLALEAAKKMAKDTGAQVDEGVNASLGELRPFVRAAQLLDDNPKAAAEALQVATPGVAERVPAAKEIADALWRNPSVATEERVVAAMAAGETQQAEHIGDGDPKNAQARGETARAELQHADLARAEKTLQPFKNDQSSTAIRLARADLAYRRGKKAEAQRELQPLLDRSPPDAAALAYVASLPPNAFDEATEALAVRAAQRVSRLHPGVASAIAVRAVRGGNASTDSVGLISVDDLKSGDVNDLGGILDRLNARGSNRSFLETLKALKGRREAKVVDVPKGGTATKLGTGVSTSVPLATTPTATGARKVEQTPKEVQQIATLLVPLLETFPPLSERRTGTALVRPISGTGEPFWSLHQVNSSLLGSGIEHALSATPYSLGVVSRPYPVDDVSKSLLARMAVGEKANFLVLYKLSADGSDAHVYLALYDVQGGELYEYADNITGRQTGLVRFNPLVVPLAVAVLGALAFLVWMFFINVGEVHVELKRDPGSDKEAITLLVTKRGKAPVITDQLGYHKRMLGRGPKRSGHKATMAGGKTIFPRVRAGSWWVHAFGTLEKGGEVRPLPEGLSYEIKVERSGKSMVRIDLDPNATEYHVRVHDGEPVEGARVFMNDDITNALLTDRHGQAILHVPKGNHTVHVDAKDVRIDRTVSSTGGKVQVLAIDLVRERRERELAKGIALSEHAGGETTGQRTPMLSLDGDTAVPKGTTAPDVPTQVQPGREAGTDVDARPAADGLRRYQRIKELGRGAMGIVFRGRDTVLERDVAIKIVSDDVRNNKQALEMFLQEGKAMAALNHPNLVTVYDQGIEGNETFMVMEFIDGQTLESMVQQRGLVPVAEVLEIAEQMCAGLGYAHGRRILHRDIKPANIFLTGDGVVKIGDFGLARAVQQARLTQTKVCGTPLYMSPEQIRGSGVDFRSDLYSVGCTLFELLTGRPPFVTGEVMYHHMYTPPQKPSEINPQLPAEIDTLILSCLEKQMDARVSSADDLRARLRPLKKQYS